MGIIRTDKWLEEEFDRPTKICEKLLPAFKGQTAPKIYNQLTDFGMYRASRRTKEIFNSMKENMVWEVAEGIFQAYRKKWGGPDIPIYLFPIGQDRSLFPDRMKKLREESPIRIKCFYFFRTV